MDIISEESEERLSEFLPLISENPGSWMCIHVNMAPVNKEAFNNEALSRQVLDEIYRISVQIAQKMYDLGLSEMDGRIFVFEDSDVLALFVSEIPSQSEEVIKKLRSEFVAKRLAHILFTSSMKDKLASLISLSRDKAASAEEIKMKKLAVDVAGDVFSWKEPNPKITDAIQKMRAQRTTGVILVVDDDLIARGLVASALKKEYKVVQAKNGKGGITAYINHAPNMVLLDIHLPDHTGHEVLNRIKLLDPEAYVVALSADSVADNVVTSLSEGSAGFIKKPFSVDKLLAYIQKCPTLGPEARARALGWSTMSSPFKIK